MLTRWTRWLVDDRELRPLRAVLHPAFVVAVVVLVVNDHVLKHSALSGALTGKLSDFAGLFFAPVLLAALAGVRTRRGLMGCAAAVAAVFAGINVSPTLATVWDSLVSLVWPFQTTTDPTDLFALPFAALGIWVLEPSMRATSPRATRRALEYAAVTLAGLSSIATSEPCTEENGCFDEPEQSAQVSILNKTNELHVLRVRYPRARVEMDCDAVSEDPNEYLKDAIFGPPETWFVQSGQEIPVQPTIRDEWGGVVATPQGRCFAALVESDTAPDVLLFWDADLPFKTFPFDADVPREIPADPQTVVLDADYDEASGELNEWRQRSDCGERADLCSEDLLGPLAEVPPGTRYFWRSRHTTDLHFERPTVNEGTLTQPPEQCRMPDSTAGVSWERPPSGDQRVVGIEPGIDGCHQLMLRGELEQPDIAEPRGWWLCVPFDSIAWLAPGEDGSQTRIAVTERNIPASLFDGGYEGLSIGATQLDAEGEILTWRRIHVVRGYGVPEEVDFGFGVEPREGCGPVESVCGQVGVPVDVTVSQFSERIAPGEARNFGEVQPIDIHLVRAEYRPVRDRNCENDQGLDLFPQNPEGLVGYMEAVITK